MAMKSTPGRAPGKKSLLDLYNMNKVTPETIAYAAIIVSHLLLHTIIKTLIRFSSVGTSSTPKSPGQYKMAVFTLTSFSKTSSNSLMIKNGLM